MYVREVRPADADPIAAIYNHYILNSHSTFEVEPIDAAEMSRRTRELTAEGYPFLVAESEGAIVGYAYAHRWRERAAYSRSAEVSVYIEPHGTNKGIGVKLYEVLIPSLADRGFHALIAGISLPNEASIRLHERFGFEKVAHFREIGRKFDRWIDVGYWELLISGTQ